MVPDRDLGRDAVGRWVSGPVGPRHGRPPGRRARTGRSQVHAHRHRPAVVERPARVRRPRERGHPADTREQLVARIAALEAERAAVIEEADALAVVLPGLGIEVRALGETSGVGVYRERRTHELREGEARLAALRTTSASNPRRMRYIPILCLAF